MSISPQRIYVIESEESIAKLDTLTRCRYGAKTVLLIAYDEAEAWKNPLQEGIQSGVEDASIVTTHIMLEACNLGIDSCWVNYFPNIKLEDAFNLPKTERSVLLLPLGYREDDVTPLPGHTKKKELNQTIKRI